MTFQIFSSYLERIEATTSRNQITETLAELFNQLESTEIESACWLLLGRILPPYEGLEFQFAEKMMIRAIARAYTIEPDVVLSEYKRIGDLATVAEKHAQTYTATQQVVSISIAYDSLTALAKDSGEGSQERKVLHVISLLQMVDSLSVRYLVRIILTKLRLGFSDMTILDALSWAKYGDKSKRKLLEETYQMKCDIGKLAKAFLMQGEEGLEDFDVELGIPIQPALCQRLKTAQEMIEKMGKLYAEAKYDGTRVQIHISRSTDWRVRTYTRSLEESSHMFPELVERVSDFGDHDLILDCEAVGFDPATNKLLLFQDTIQRKRKHGVEEISKTIPLRFFIFDVLYMDGKSLLSVPLSQRKKILHDLFTENSTLIRSQIFSESGYIITEDPDELRAFHKAQLNLGLEGAVIKKFDSSYQPGRRGWSWVKFKEEESSQAKLSDTVDAVVMGYWYGKGKRTGFGVGAFLIGVRNESEQYMTLSKVGTGLTDDQWREFKERCASHIVTEKPQSYVVDKLLLPDVWVDPAVVVEVAGDELTKSPNHSAGVALRFPRLVRFRDDKKVVNSTTVSELASIS